jgi:hypothetical protein
MKEQLRALVRQKIVDGLSRPAPELTRRDIWLPGVPGKATAVIGIRRAGKTCLLWQIMSDRLARGTAREGLLYFSFEDERLAGMQVQDLELLVEEYYRLYPEWREQKRATFLLDEIQLVPGWEMFIRRLLDSEKIDLFLSGSSARLLSREIASSMRGRAMEAAVYPFSFRESLRHARLEPRLPPQRLTKAARSSLDKHLAAYLRQGGFPEAQGLDLRNHLELLRGYVDVVLLRDVVERHAVTHPLALRWLVRQLLGNAGGLFSINKFYTDLKSQGVAIGKDTLHDYLGYLEDAFLLRSVTIASDSERRRRVNPRKVYPIDPGLIPVFDRSGKTNIGHALETAVLLELDRRRAETGYVRTASGFEIDFHASYPDGHRQLIQVCASLDDPDTLAREVRALREATAEFSGAEQLIVTLDRPSILAASTDVKIMTAPDFFLSAGYDEYSAH